MMPGSGRWIVRLGRTAQFTSRTGMTNAPRMSIRWTRGIAATDAFTKSSRRGTHAARVRLQVASACAERSPVVRNQIARSATRLPGKDALPIIRELLGHDQDDADPQIPLLIWWAIESKAVSDRDQVIGWFSSPAIWARPLVRRH